jgi:hypothetical protein
MADRIRYYKSSLIQSSITIESVIENLIIPETLQVKPFANPLFPHETPSWKNSITSYLLTIYHINTTLLTISTTTNIMYPYYSAIFYQLIGKPYGKSMSFQ